MRIRKDNDRKDRWKTIRVERMACWLEGVGVVVSCHRIQVGGSRGRFYPRATSIWPANKIYHCPPAPLLLTPLAQRDSALWILSTNWFEIQFILRQDDVSTDILVLFISFATSTGLVKRPRAPAPAPPAGRASAGCHPLLCFISLKWSE